MQSLAITALTFILTTELIPIIRIKNMQQHNDLNEWVELEEQVISVDAYNNCCGHVLVGKDNAESRD